MGDDSRANEGGSARGRRGPIVRACLLPYVAWATAVLGLLTVLQFVVGRVVTDRVHVIQYIWWTPPSWSVLSAWGLLLVSWVSGWVSLRSKGLMLRPLLLLGCLGMTGWVLLGEWSVHRYVTGSGGSAQRAGTDSVRVLHWNLSASKVREGGYWSRMLDDEPDIVLIANARFGSDLRMILQSTSPLAPADELVEAKRRYKVPGRPGHFLITHRGLIASRLPITRAGVVSSGPLVNTDNESRASGEHGWVIFAEFERGEGGEPLVVWFVDLPSDPLTSRMESMRVMRDAIDAWDGRTLVPNETGWDSIPGADVFPTPDLVIGDFNALRGSASLDTIAPGYRDAFGLAGRGPGRSWVPNGQNRLLRQPLKLSSWHIDLALAAPGWDVLGYELVNPRRGPHRVQIVELAPAR